MVKQFTINIPTFFPSPINATEVRFYGMNQSIVTVAGLCAIFLDNSVRNGDGVDWSALSFQIRWAHLGCLILLVSLGPNVSPMGFVARLFAVYGVGNRVEPCSGSPKLFSQLIALVCVTITVIGEALLGPKSVPSILPAVVLLICALLDAILGFCVGCWFYKLLCQWFKIPHSEEFTTEELLEIYTGWPMISWLSKNVIQFREMLQKSDAADSLDDTNTDEELGQDDMKKPIESENDKGNDATSTSNKWETVCEGGVCKLVRKKPQEEPEQSKELSA